MGNGGSKPYVPPPPEQMPIKDSIAERHEAAAMMADKSALASRSANDLNEGTMDNAKAVTRNQIGKAETFAPQARPTGPAGLRPKSPRVAPGSVLSGMSGSAILTG